MNSERHILSILLENTSGALAHVAGLFAARVYNIESISAAPTENPTVTRITIGSRGDATTVEQIMKHLNRLIEVIKVLDLTENEYVERELMLVKVRAVGRNRDELMRIAEIFRARIVDVTEKTFTIEVTGTTDKNTAFLKAIDHSLILETVRTGAGGIARGERMIRL